MFRPGVQRVAAATRTAGVMVTYLIPGGVSHLRGALNAGLDQGICRNHTTVGTGAAAAVTCWPDLLLTCLGVARTVSGPPPQLGVFGQGVVAESATSGCPGPDWASVASSASLVASCCPPCGSAGLSAVSPGVRGSWLGVAVAVVEELGGVGA